MIYYIETNIIAVTIGVLLLYQERRLSSKNETSWVIFNQMLRLLVAVSVSDVAAYCFRGRNYWGVQISNILYFLAMAAGTYLWFLFICIKTEQLTSMKRGALYAGVPMAVLCAAIVLNPLTGFFFTVDDALLYHRGPGVMITWVVEWGYMLGATVVNVRAVLKEKRSHRRSEFRGYLLFAIPLAVAAVCQMLFYGITVTQIGYAIALLLSYINQQFYQVQRDDLTGLNNQNAFLNYRDSMVNRSKPVELTLFMMDADDFKPINDIYGHLKGDQALRDIAEVLKCAINVLSHKRVILYRYAGDEFVIVGKDMTEEDVAVLCGAIEEQLVQMNAYNEMRGERYHLAISMGVATKVCADVVDFDALHKAADNAMYLEKKSKGRKR